MLACFPMVLYASEKFVLKMLYIICDVRQNLESKMFFFILRLLKSRGELPGEFGHISVLHYFQIPSCLFMTYHNIRPPIVFCLSCSVNMPM